ncbi:NmrA family NAD(P)-binding protein [Candidatus Bathyarchaeota archaeon]|nr:NmrA family NAD(P)-binding protein [Candidatus Bathyarchaeota archaeon]
MDGGLTETDIGKAVVDAAAEAGVRVFVFSGMESVLKMTGGKMSSPNFEGKTPPSLPSLPSFPSLPSPISPFYPTPAHLLTTRRKTRHSRIRKDKDLRQRRQRQPGHVHGEPAHTRHGGRLRRLPDGPRRRRRPHLRPPALGRLRGAAHDRRRGRLRRPRARRAARPGEVRRAAGAGD